MNASAIHKDAIEVRWLSEHFMRKELCAISCRWATLTERDVVDCNLGCILSDVWAAEHRLAPFPEVAVAFYEQCAVGIVCGTTLSTQKCFFIDHLVVHPRYNVTKTGFPAMHAIQECLVEAAIDHSQACGYHGWLACCPEPGTEAMWRRLGFSKEDSFIYRRMGYFTQMPAGIH
ncbi:hypothetical protein [Alicyclobacillus acidoterrestris]|uniref:Uncharacterized protein n=1 Tax=Alicyclobacillus acidoterrestris (strain ATCC 49025 / DSM 3922 / CIP 106132 / NCIMB 13137 / GD3B) TaxID=1356854 RepID=T0BJX1_ALIAG|nr:hypothetical protein [Alicyclobacillus acidoterrestris]EPZ41024.1 hypothetical protein N007_17515 [Alicyclobacillus acidoterrestris ATCC 49025]UNO47812.1 hypothetical protein K1I37_14100 [Alicyclobacillus acidoterrestris]GEO27184.1 hypothetical protein AAC03nite_29690 [Alicyclobacillus acidoterrestris]